MGALEVAAEADRVVAIASSFADFLKANIFDPLGMTHNVLDDSSRPARQKLAQGYLEKKVQFERWDYPLLTVGDADLFSTLNDLFLWDQALNTERFVPRPPWSEPLPRAQPTTAYQLAMASADTRMSFLVCVSRAWRQSRRSALKCAAASATISSMAADASSTPG